MLIDAAHSEELRVVVLNDDKIEDFEVETTGKEQIKGNIYVAEVTRVEPSLQAAFINYGGNRNGFLAFSEIHPGYFDLPAEEKEALLNELTEIANRRKGRDQEQEERIEKEQAEKKAARDQKKSEKETAQDNTKPTEQNADSAEKNSDKKSADKNADTSKGSKSVKEETPESLNGLTPEEMEADAKALAIASTMVIDNETPSVMDTVTEEKKEEPKKRRGRPAKKPKRHSKKETSQDDETLENDSVKASEENANKSADEAKEEEKEERRLPIHRRYSIDQVVKEGQRILIQVNKEERGNKGAAVSTYISLPGRYSVLMPNTPYAGGISRKITDFAVRREIKSIVNSLEVPDAMGVIIRTAGVGQEADSIKKDVDNLLSLWKKIEKAFEGNKKPPFVTHEDGSLAVRAIRDMFNDEIDEVQVSNRKTYRMAKDYMKSLMPESAKKVKEYKLQTPIFTHYGVEEKLNRLHTTRVNLPSGGYLIINPTEALVSVDVNSGKATQEKNIEETALKTNLEAAEEVCRQLRLRDLAGLVVIDFIDMEETKNERAVEKMMRKCVRKDRARIQIAPISTFGLLEMSRQRLRPSLGESTMQACTHCNGTGLVPSLASAALTLLRSLEDENIRNKAERVIITTSDDLAIYILNHKRPLIKDMEARYGFDIFIRGDDKYHAPDHKIEVIRTDNRGVEKRQSHEVVLREPLDEGDNYKKKGRRRTKKDKNDKNTHQKKGANQNQKQNKQSSKDKNDDHKKHEKHEKHESKSADNANNVNDKNESAKTTDDSSNNEDKKDSRRKGGRVRHLRRGNRRRDNNKEAEGSQASTEQNKTVKAQEPTKADANTKNETTDKKANDGKGEKPSKPQNRRSRPQSKKATAEEQPKKELNKGIVVEHVTDSGKTSVSESKSETVTGKFQRWWSKTTS